MLQPLQAPLRRKVGHHQNGGRIHDHRTDKYFIKEDADPVWNAPGGGHQASQGRNTRSHPRNHTLGMGQEEEAAIEAHPQEVEMTGPRQGLAQEHDGRGPFRRERLATGEEGELSLLRIDAEPPTTAPHLHLAQRLL